MLDHLAPLTVPQRAAELLASVSASLDADALAMDQALAPWQPETDWEARSEQQRRDWLALRQRVYVVRRRRRRRRGVRARRRISCVNAIAWRRTWAWSHLSLVVMPQLRR